ncbi:MULTISPECIES: hypothetical protein [Burkholderiaceae]|uniref:Uncharacterized protein n=1 Tax=Caballeronia sordidicola TaxID=196367 RepID=A0A242N7U6_CABSO|nr:MULTISPECIES: hypothetical protein [Burkholderiaceae]OTP79662.1 hypothetical protein PAMC26577_01945 [Caballeronia sordidicola]
MARFPNPAHRLPVQQSGINAPARLSYENSGGPGATPGSSGPDARAHAAAGS